MSDRLPVKFNSTKHGLLVLFIRLCSYDVGYALKSRARDDRESKAPKARRYIDLQSWPSSIQDIKRRTTTTRGQEELVTSRRGFSHQSLHVAAASAHADDARGAHIISSASLTSPTGDQRPNEISRYTRLQATGSRNSL